MDKYSNLSKAELKVMNVLWRNGDMSAKKIREILGEEIGWKKQTTYTVIIKCIEKGTIERIEPGFICHALITQEEAREYETAELIKMYDGAADSLIASILGKKILTSEEIERLKQIVNDLE